MNPKLNKDNFFDTDLSKIEEKFLKNKKITDLPIYKNDCIQNESNNFVNIEKIIKPITIFENIVYFFKRKK
jgi:hypothetical protein